jgi:hypothetical protein
MVRNSVVEALFAVGSPPLEHFGEFGKLRISIYDPFPRDLISNEVIYRLEEGFDVGIVGHCSASKDNGHDD